MADRFAGNKCIPDSLKCFFEENKKVALAFSGGTDSAYLLYAAKACGCDIRAYYVRTAFQPEFETRDAEKMSAEQNVEMTVVEVDILGRPEIAENPANRCYFCKRALFTELIKQASADGYDTVIDGTNASDDAGDRPGMRALYELGVRSPLRECGVTKIEVREYSRQAGLFTWEKPAYACLATRVPANTPITRDILEKVEGAEDALFRMGFTDFRVRVYMDAARLQMPGSQMARAIEMRREIREAVEKYFPVVMLDLKER
ncbi:MAG: ATP-dependent sacrificial sulfur transferase LarE [Clostridiales bacterium]|nr:ATP-dependent sacrificial sulfur transferase LarE [Clostridiales bacterium]